MKFSCKNCSCAATDGDRDHTKTDYGKWYHWVEGPTVKIGFEGDHQEQLDNVHKKSECYEKSANDVEVTFFQVVQKHASGGYDQSKICDQGECES